MWEITPELQKKIHRLMYLKYRKHRKMINLSLACLFIYSIFVFLILTRFCTIQIEVNEISRFCLLYLAFWLIVSWSVFFPVSEDSGKKLSVMWFDSRSSIFSVKNRFVSIFLYWLAIVIYFVLEYDDSMLHWLLLFLWGSICFFILCFLSNNRKIRRNNFLFVYYLFFFIFLWPVIEATIDGIPVIAKIWKIIFSMSPFLFLLFRSSLTDFIWSGYIVRKWFKVKDSEVWNCPWCHWYIMKKPIRYCPHCGNDSLALDGQSFVHLCRNCWFFMKIKETDFPNFCPHCGLSFKSKYPRTYS